MVVQIPCFGFRFMHRLVYTYGQRHREILVKLPAWRKEIRTISTGASSSSEDERNSSPLNTSLTSRQALLSRRGRPLSPLERISRLLPQDALSPEVEQLRQNQEEPKEDENIQKKDQRLFDATISHYCSTQGEYRLAETHTEDEAIPNEDPDTSHAIKTAVEPNISQTHRNGHFPCEVRRISPVLPGENLLVFGELLIAEYRKNRRVEFRKMFQLQTGTHLQSCWGVISHDDMVGQLAGQFLKTNRGTPIFIRRPSLEDYTLYMKRGPAIAYPKDANTMLMMMDVTEGDCVLESGSGSGAMSLFLSRAVGSKGKVVSVEVREDHHRRAVSNYNRWRASWRLRQGEEWPDNVRFHQADLSTASSLLACQGFRSVALDMVSPHMVLPSVIPHLHSGAVCAVYLSNITQVIDLLEGLRCLALPLLCERIIEVPIRNWLVAPARQKDGRYCTKKAPILDKEQREENEASDECEKDEINTQEPPAFGSIPYIARPHHEQMSHTAFLVKLRKYVL
ncbi:hypothetical protein LDENG_00176410 [Lucifuga dentata]|nr:hypothetical protein LDENG_00176410 [Lucifuga dentata]